MKTDGGGCSLWRTCLGMNSRKRGNTGKLLDSDASYVWSVSPSYGRAPRGKDRGMRSTRGRPLSKIAFPQTSRVLHWHRIRIRLSKDCIALICSAIASSSDSLRSVNFRQRDSARVPSRKPKKRMRISSSVNPTCLARCIRPGDKAPSCRSGAGRSSSPQAAECPVARISDCRWSQADALSHFRNSQVWHWIILGQSSSNRVPKLQPSWSKNFVQR